MQKVREAVAPTFSVCDMDIKLEFMRGLQDITLERNLSNVLERVFCFIDTGTEGSSKRTTQRSMGILG